jgi:membrane-anchored protein YejM (alkaline phosphatase superfamily)
LQQLNNSQRLRVHGFFIAINALVSMCIAARYFTFLPVFPSDLVAVIFIFAATFGQMVLLAGVLGLLTLPFIYLPAPWRRFSQVTIASLGVALLYFDTLVFAQYRFHMNAVVVDLAMSADVVTFPLLMWLKGLGIIALVFLLQFLLLRYLEQTQSDRTEVTSIWKRKRILRYFSLFTFMTLLMTHGIHIWAAAVAYQPVTMVKRYLPLFYPSTSNRTMAKYGFVNEQSLAQQEQLKMSKASDLHYPLKPLSVEAPDEAVNIMIILVDSWRADTFNAENTPNMWRYAQKGVSFEHHLAAANATRTGVFGLFYGIPGTYWHSFLSNNQPPILIERLQALDYSMGIFAAAKLTKPEFSQTVFKSIPDLRIASKGRSPSARDEDLTNDWIAWDEQRDKQKPAFSFLFYDAPHGYDFPIGYAHRFEPMTAAMNYLELDNDFDPVPVKNRYKTSVHYVDSQVKRVLERLEKTGDLENTLVIITGDHGQEMNDNKLNFWGHNGNYTNAQIQVPVAMFGPKIAQNMKNSGENFTAHQDLVPTLARNYLGVRNDLSDYSVGVDLLSEPIDRDWLIASKYSGYGIVTKDSIIEIGAAGNYQLLDKTNRPSSSLKLNPQHLKGAFEQMSLFSK